MFESQDLKKNINNSDDLLVFLAKPLEEENWLEINFKSNLNIIKLKSY
jgi:hypothetical protein